jgi:hypothetical protein
MFSITLFMNEEGFFDDIGAEKGGGLWDVNVTADEPIAYQSLCRSVRKPPPLSAT